jgi:hypothetical protein
MYCAVKSFETGLSLDVSNEEQPLLEASTPVVGAGETNGN